MRFVLLTLLLLLAAPLRAGEMAAAGLEKRHRAPAVETLRAANERAVASLLDQIVQLPITSRVTVREFLRDVDGHDEMMSLLRRADQIGGPRWLDESTVQVQLEISPARVAATLKQLAAARSKATSVTAAQIEDAMERWPRRLSAVGSGAASTRLYDVEPRRGGPWASVSREGRKKALGHAQDDAAKQVMNSVGRMHLNHKTLGDAFARPQVGDAVRNWLVQRPITSVDFRDDLNVEVVLAVDEAELFKVVQEALRQQKEAPALSADEWEKLRLEFVRKVPRALGKASATAQEPASSFELPRRAPEWVDQQIEVRGLAAGGSSKLKLALAAEADAHAKLKTRLATLPLGNTTVGEAASKNPPLADALQRAVKRARIYKTEYNPDGVAVNLTADLKDLWDELRVVGGQ